MRLSGLRGGSPPILLCIACAAVGAVGAADSRPAAVSDPKAASYVLGPDDEITIRALHADEITDKPFRVDPLGYLSLPIIGRVRAGGLTVEQLAHEVSSRLNSFIREPEVSIRVTEFRSQPLSVLGAVKNPGVYRLRGRTTLIEALSSAGGLEPDSGGTIHITRQSECGTVPLDNAQPDPSGRFSTPTIDYALHRIPSLESSIPTTITCKLKSENFILCAHIPISSSKIQRQ